MKNREGEKGFIGLLLLIIAAYLAYKYPDQALYVWHEYIRPLIEHLVERLKEL